MCVQSHRLLTCETRKADALIAERQVNTGAVVVAWWWLTLINTNFTEVTWRAKRVELPMISSLKNSYLCVCVLLSFKGVCSTPFISLRWFNTLYSHIYTQNRKKMHPWYWIHSGVIPYFLFISSDLSEMYHTLNRVLHWYLLGFSFKQQHFVMCA